MSRALPFFKFDADDWLTGKIQLLSALEKGVFIDLVARIWKENGVVRNDEFLHRLIRVPKPTLSKALNAFFATGIMYEENGFLRVKFVDEQLNERSAYIEKQREIGRRGGRTRKGAKPKQKEDNRKKIEDIIIETTAVVSSPEPENSGFPGRRNIQKIYFDYDGDCRIHGVTPAQMNLWKESYPAIDVAQEIRKAAAWLDANRKNRKKDVKWFLVNWLNRIQERTPRITTELPKDLRI